LARFSDQFIMQVAQATDIVELVSQYVALVKRGKEHVGLCPFHDDSRPSMYVSPAKQIYKCFACGAGGGVFQFLMQYDKVTFPEAVRSLAEKANIPLPQADRSGRSAGPDGQAGVSRNDLFKVVAFAARFFQSRLGSAAGGKALDYARRRGLSEQSIKRFAIGYSPDGWDALTLAAGRERISASQLVAAGLAARRESGGCYDRFRGRLMFPIYDPQDRPVGFGARALKPDEQAKYINSPASAVFDKSAQLYALNWSREGIVSTGRAVVVEGYLDALMAIQHGMGNVVATLGTALNDRHVRLLSRYARQVVLVFDADAAGQAAAERAMEIFLAQRLDVRVATIPAGKDPCDYCLAEGGEAMARLVDEAPDAIEHAWQLRQAAWRQAGASLAERRRLVDEFLSLVVSSAAYGAIDGIRQGQLAQHISHLLNVSAVELQRQMQRLGRRVRKPAAAADAPATPAGDVQDPAERNVLEVLLNDGDLFDVAAERIGPEDFTVPEYRHIARLVWQCGAAGQINIDELLANPALAECGGLLTDLAAAGQRRGNFGPTLDGAVDYMLYRRNRREIEGLKASGRDDQALRELTRRLKAPDIRRRPSIQ